MALATTLSLGHAQIVIPDVNRDTIKTVPPPPGFDGKRIQTQVPNSGQQAPDDRCNKLSEALRRTTPGCQ